VTFGQPGQAATTATFSQPGEYVLVLGVDDGIHAVAYDAVHVTVALPVSISREGNDAIVHFPTVSGRTYRIEVANSLAPPQTWMTLFAAIAGTGNRHDARHPSAFSQGACFYRISVLP
jgi:hypothetical protein